MGPIWVKAIMFHYGIERGGTGPRCFTSSSWMPPYVAGMRAISDSVLILGLGVAACAPVPRLAVPPTVFSQANGTTKAKARGNQMKGQFLFPSNPAINPPKQAMAAE